jgi:hypothetical protein
LNHQVFWGNEKFIFSSDHTLSVSQTYLYVTTTKRYADNSIERSAIGNKYQTDKVLQFKKVLVEFLYSKDQGKGHWANDPTYSSEEYYNNYICPEGWSYKGIGLGIPFISTKTYIRQGLSSDNQSNFINNRVIALHMGLEGSIAR